MRPMNSYQNSCQCKNNMSRGCSSSNTPGNWNNINCGSSRPSMTEDANNGGCDSDCGNSRQNMPVNNNGCDRSCAGSRQSMPVNNNGCDSGCGDSNRCLGRLPVGMAYVPIQEWKNIFDSCLGLKHATIFKDLVLPYMNTNCPNPMGRRGH